MSTSPLRLLPHLAECPYGTTPINDPSSGGSVCVDADGNIVGILDHPPPILPPPPGSPPVGRVPTVPPQRPPTAPFGPRQPGAPAAPYNPPGRIGLWPGPIFNVGSGPVTSVTSSSGASIGGAVAGEGPIFVNVNNATNLADSSAATAVGNVADAVSSAIQSSVNAASQAADNASSAVVNALTQQTGAISAGVGQIFGSLLSGIQGIETGVGNALGGIGATIGNDIQAALNPSTDALARIALIISNQLGGLAGAISQAVAVIIPQIIRAISDPIAAITGVLKGIGADIAAGVQAQVQIGSDIGGGFSSLDSTLGRIFTQYADFTEAQTGYPDGGSLHHDLSDIVKQLAGLVTSTLGTATPKFRDQIQTFCAGKDLDALLNKPWTPPEGDGGYFYDVWYIFSKFLASLLTWTLSVIPAVQKATQEATQRLDQACPIDLLPVSALVDAQMRGFLTDADAVAEAQKGNLNESRFHLLRDLATHQMSPAELVEALYRSIVSEPDFRQALTAQGWTSGQQDLLKSLGVALLTVSEGLELLRRQTIDAPTLDAILKAHAYDDAQRKALESLAFRPQNVSEAVSGEASQRGLAGVGLSGDPDLFTAPEFVQTAGAAEGLDHDATTARWLSHWNTGSLSNWITLFFRSQITQGQLESIAARDFVPASVLPALIDSQRPLVQFRTISQLLRLNIIDEANARLLLRQHGYSDNNIDVLVKYAQRPGPAHAPKNAQALHSVSLSIAKEEYIDGSITGDQYLAILTQHGYTLDGANTELQVVNAHQALIRRKEAAQLVIDEYGAGLINEQAALAQLAVLGLTVDELARAAHKIRAFRVKMAKHPSESDLNHFLQLSIISSDEYVAELKAQGYADKWAQSFLAWRQHPSTSPSPGLQPSAAAPTG